MSMTEHFPATVSANTADRRGQGTMVEQARAETEVRAMVYLAREFPRDEGAAEKRMLRACGRLELAEAAFYSYEKGGKTVSDLTVHAACEIALIWGNITFGLTEMRRDDEYGQSEMQAYAWELESNARIASTFIVPHLRSAGGKRLNDPRDVYEINTNQGNRRMRAAVLKVLPRWYVDGARRALRDTLRRSVEQSKKPLAEQIREAAGWFEGKFGLTLGQLEEWAGRPVARWDADQLVSLRTLGHTLTRGEIRIEEAFPQAKVTAEEIAAGSPAPADEPERGVLVNAALVRRLEAEILAAPAAPELGDVLHRAIEHRDAGDLTQDEYVHLDVIASQRYDRIPPHEADSEARGGEGDA